MARNTIRDSRKPRVMAIRRLTEMTAISMCSSSSFDFSAAVSPYCRVMSKLTSEGITMPFSGSMRRSTLPATSTAFVPLRLAMAMVTAGRDSFDAAFTMRTYSVGSAPPSVTSATLRTNTGLSPATPTTTFLTSSEVRRNSPVSKRYSRFPESNLPDGRRRLDSPSDPTTCKADM